MSRPIVIFKEDGKISFSNENLLAKSPEPIVYSREETLNALNRKENRNAYNAYRSRVVMRDMPTRADALEWEKENSRRLG